MAFLVLLLLLTQRSQRSRGGEAGDHDLRLFLLVLLGVVFLHLLRKVRQCCSHRWSGGGGSPAVLHSMARRATDRQRAARPLRQHARGRCTLPVGRAALPVGRLAGVCRTLALAGRVLERDARLGDSR